jgi:hypothetical protein
MEMMMLNKNEINKIIGEPEGWFPPVEKLLPDTAEEFIAMMAAIDKEVEEERSTGLTIVEMGKCRGSTYPTCSICDYDAEWGIMPNRVADSKLYSVDSRGEELADGKPCKIYNACRRHLHEVSKICRETEELKKT